jgi:hypothetical protein
MFSVALHKVFLASRTKLTIVLIGFLDRIPSSCRREASPTTNAPSATAISPTPTSQPVYVRSISNNPGNVHILGNLYLSDLKYESEELQQLVRPCFTGLQQLDRRDMTCEF